MNTATSTFSEDRYRPPSSGASVGSNESSSTGRVKSNTSLPECVALGLSNSTEKFEELVRDVVAHYKATAACVALQSPNEMHLKASFGMACSRQPLTSLTRHACGRPLPIIIDDTLALEPFCNDQLVKGIPYARFCIVVPIMGTDTACIGSLCIFDAEPRSGTSLEECTFAEEAAGTLRDLFKEAVEKDHGRNVWQMTLESLPEFPSGSAANENDVASDEESCEGDAKNKGDEGHESD